MTSAGEVFLQVELWKEDILRGSLKNANSNNKKKKLTLNAHS